MEKKWVNACLLQLVSADGISVRGRGIVSMIKPFVFSG